jgi:hypothetical protein
MKRGPATEVCQGELVFRGLSVKCAKFKSRKLDETASPNVVRRESFTAAILDVEGGNAGYAFCIESLNYTSTLRRPFFLPCAYAHRSSHDVSPAAARRDYTQSTTFERDLI